MHSLKAIEQNFPVVLFIMLYKMVLGFDSVEEIPYFEHSHEVKAIEQAELSCSRWFADCVDKA